jgi:hypothetical protein
LEIQISNKKKNWEKAHVLVKKLIKLPLINSIERRLFFVLFRPRRACGHGL